MNTGKQICDILKSIRKEIAKQYNLDYKPSECDFEGDCVGFCEKCDAELRDLERQLMKKDYGIAGFIYTQFDEDVANRCVNLVTEIKRFMRSGEELAGVPSYQARQEKRPKTRIYDGESKK